MPHLTLNADVAGCHCAYGARRHLVRASTRPCCYIDSSHYFAADRKKHQLDWQPLRRCGASFAAALLLHTAPVCAAEVVQGPARAVDGDTLVVAGTRVRLYGVDAPETAQVCKDGAGHDYACGKEAADALRARIGQSELRCEVRNRDQYGRGVASCSLPGAGGDLGAWLVKNGLAVAYRQYGSEYVAAEEGAHAAGRGIWVGEFELPAQWRRERKIDRLLAAPPLTVPAFGPSSAPTPAQRAPTPAPAAARTQPPPRLPAPALGAIGAPGASPAGGCVIKGNIGSHGDRIYHVPGGRFYAGTKVDPATGERWFCSAAEAEAAGWRAARL